MLFPLNGEYVASWCDEHLLSLVMSYIITVDAFTLFIYIILQVACLKYFHLDFYYMLSTIMYDILIVLMLSSIFHILCCSSKIVDPVLLINYNG